MKKILLAVVTFAPSLALAAGSGAVGIDTGGLSQSVTGLTDVVNRAISLMIAVAVIAFIYGVIRFVLAKNGDDQKNARSFLIWSVIAIFAILAVFGIARLLINLFNLDPAGLGKNEVPTVPAIPTSRG
jgi:phosphotransferase system  glucose/maltose/N-acetylglucosamine-specific IIC component